MTTTARLVTAAVLVHALVGGNAYAQTLCVHSHGYWRTHGDQWPVQSLVLGNPANPLHEYAQPDLLRIMQLPARTDASISLATQLTAARLNIASGSSPAPIRDDLLRADVLLGSFANRVPLRIAPSTPIGAEMAAIAARLDDYNNGRLADSCGVANRAPVASAGPDQTLPLNTTVTLDGSGSSDPDSDPLTYQWLLLSKPETSGAVLSSVDAVMPTFVLDVPGSYVVQLTVSDGRLTSAPATVRISTLNSRPVANAGPDQRAFVSSTVTLDGSGSTDVDGDPLTFAWSFVSRPAASTTTLSSPTDVAPSFAVDAFGDYVVQLVVSDGTLESVADTVAITTENTVPVANAGADTTGFVGDTITLNGGGSIDADGNPLSYRWAIVSQPAGSQATLSDPNAVNPTFAIDASGTYVVQLIVNDGMADSTPDTVAVTTLNSRPVANAGADLGTLVGATVTLDGSASSDVDGNQLTYTWSLTTRPAGSLAALSDPSAVRPTFMVDVAGTYVAQLIVNDGAVDSAPDTVSISTGNRLPTAAAGVDQTVGIGATVQLDGSGSSDPDNDPLTFRWALASRPTDSTAALSSATTPTPTFVADVAGTYVAQLIVNDGTGDSPPDTVMVTTENSIPVANAGPDQNVTPGSLVQLDGGASFDPDGRALQYSWSLIARPTGSIATLDDPSVANPTFTADVAGIYVAQLIVGDGIHLSAPDTVTIAAQSPVDLAIEFYFPYLEPGLGETVNFSLTARNLSFETASDVGAQFLLPNGYTLVDVQTSGTATYDSTTGRWAIGELLPFQSASLVVTAIVQTAGTYTLTASVRGSAPDPNPANDTATVDVTPNVNADLELSMYTFFGSQVQPGLTSNYVFDLWNLGPSNATGVTVSVPLPAGYTFAAVETTEGTTYDPTTGTWTVGPMTAYYSFARLNLALTVNATGPLAFVAAIRSSSQPDPDPADNTVAIPAPNRPPRANAGADQSVSTHTTVALDGSGSSDADEQAITFDWAFVVRPLNSTAILAVPTTATPSFFADQPGNYVVRLLVRDSQGIASAVDTVTIAAVVTNHAPVIRSQPVTLAVAAQPYVYDVEAFDADGGTTLAFSLSAAPEGMTIDAASGTITWTPAEAQGGPQAVTVRVQDQGGLFAVQEFVIQVSSAANGAPVAHDDEHTARVGESLSVAAPGVLANDIDTNPLSARLVSPPANGAVILNNDGSFTYTPHTLDAGEIVLVENLNLATRMPGVTATGNACARCAIDDDLLNVWQAGGTTLEITFPSDITLSALEIVSSRSIHYVKAATAVIEVLGAGGERLYYSGRVEFPAPDRDGTIRFDNLAGVRRVRFKPEDDGSLDYFGSIAELRVIGSALIRREAHVEPNLAQLLPTSVSSSPHLMFNTPESVIDDTTHTNWFGDWSVTPTPFVEMTFPRDVTVTRLETLNPNGRPDGFGTSLTIDCFGTFTLLDASRAELFTSGLVHTPVGAMHPSVMFALEVPAVAGVRHVRYTMSSCTGAFPAGFSEVRVFGSSDVAWPAFSLSKKFQSLTGREVHSTPIVVNLTDDNGDGRIDQNDVPDIVVPMEQVTNSQLRGEIKAISGDDGRELFTAGAPDLVSPWSELAAGDLDGDGRPEIVAVHADQNHLIAFDHTGAQLWVSDPNPMPLFGAQFVGGAVSIANLDGAGAPEIVVGASVFSAQGRLIGDGRTLGGTTGGSGLRSAISAVGDIDLDGVPEIVAGPSAYRLSAGQLTRVWTRSDRADGYVAIANFDDDPQAEIVSVANGFVYMLNDDGSDVAGWNAPSHAPVAIPAGGQGGAPLVVDVDGDGASEIGVAGASYFVLFSRDGSVRWKSAISDRSSNATGAVAFDLNGDGEIEIIYRDEFWLRVYRGSDGVLLTRRRVGSATWSEEPVVADVDNDGHADIIVSSDLFLQTPGDSGIIVLQDVANQWKRTRRIWNQHSYHVTNVNEDASIPTSESPHWLVTGLNGFRTNAFVPGESADDTDRFTYVASDGILQSQPATVRVTLRTPNTGPQFSSAPVTTAAVDVPYVYAALASDPDAGDVLTYSVVSAPAGMEIDAASGVVRWTPGAAQLGPQSVVIKVADVRGVSALQSYSIQVANPVTVPDVVGQSQAAATPIIVAANLVVGEIGSRHSPSVPAQAVISQVPAAGSTAAPGSSVNLVISLGPAPTGTVPDVVGQSQSSASSDITAAGFVVGTVVAQSSTTVTAGIVMLQNPAAGTIATPPAPVDLVVSSGPPPGQLDVDGDGFTGDAGDCNDTDPSIHPGAIDTPGDGVDQNCNGRDSVVGDDVFPSAAIDSPEEDAVVTMPVAIVGTASDQNFLRATVLISGADETSFTPIASLSAPIDGGVLAQLDPTLLENGIYRLRLVAEDVNGQISVAERMYRVGGEAKVGVLALSFIDLKVPVTGIPITVVRSYDSRAKSRHDFGIGWKLEVNAGKYQNNRRPGDGWRVETAPGPFGLPCTVTTEVRSHYTELRLSDREVYLFRPRLTNLAAVVGGCVGTVTYDFVSGSTPGATLTVMGNSDIIYTSGDAVYEFDGEANTGLVFDPVDVRLTTAVGRVIDFRRGAGITRIRDANDNALEIRPTGIVHSSGRSIAFTRDAVGRITKITDPRGNVLEYEYDDDGNLVAFLDQADNRTTFGYDDDHNLIEIRDPLGNRALSTEYDAQGRAIAMVDAAGRRITFTHDIAGREELVTDGRGNVTRIVYTDRGDVALKEATVTIDGVATPVVTRYEHDALGNATVAIDPDGVRVEATYDHFNVLDQVIDPGGLALRTSHTYDARGEVLTQTDADGQVTTFQYDARGNITRFVDRAGASTLLRNDDVGRPIESIDEAGARTRVSYDGFGRVTQEQRQDAAGATLTQTNFTYDAAGNLLTRSDLLMVGGATQTVTTSYAYDARNRLIATTHPGGAVSRIEYNAIGKEAARIDALGRRTTFTYDDAGALTRTEYPDGTFETQEYDDSGNVIRHVDRAGQARTFDYDELRRRVRVTDPAGRFTRTIYTPGGRVAALIDANGNRTDIQYDTVSRPVRTIQPAVLDAASGLTRRPEIRYEYDRAGRVVAFDDPNGRRTTLTYDGVGRITRREFADGSARENRYDAAGRLVEQVDEAGRIQRFVYDALGRLVRVTDALNGVTSFAYDQSDRLVAQTDALGRTTRLVRDASGRVVERRRPSGVSEHFAYDAVGNVVSHTDFAGATTTFTYDAMNRLTRQLFPDGTSATFSYTPADARASVTDARGVTAYEYDANHRLVGVTHPTGEVLRYAYDANGNLQNLTSPAGAISYEYDALNRMVNVAATLWASGSNRARYGYDPAGNLVEIALPNGVTTRQEFDLRNRLTSIQHLNGGTTVGSFTYSLSPTGRRLSMLESDGAIERFGYDSLDRLVSEVREGVRSTTYEYDAVGNRVRTNRDGVVTTYSYDADDRPLTAGATQFTYDANGNLASQSTAGLTTSYDWDARGRLIRASGPSGITGFEYDVDGNRVARQTAAGLTRFLVDGNNPTRLAQVVEERDGAGSLQAGYSYGAGLLSATRNGGTSFLHRDGLGSTRILTDAAGAATDRYNFDAYGTLRAAHGSTPNTYLFAGEAFEPTLGFYNLRARNYDPASGRFISRDPLPGTPADPRSQHPYLYAHADPVNQTDPTGQFSLLEISTSLGIQDVLRGLDVSRTAAQYCLLKGKVEIASEVLFWGQFAALGPLVVESVFGAGAFNGAVDMTFAAKRYENIFKAPEKIVEAKAAISLAMNGDRSLGFEFTREDGGVLGAKFDLNDFTNSTFNIGAGPAKFAFGFANPGASSFALEKSFEIFKVEKCTVELVKGKFDLEGKVDQTGFKLEAAIGLEALQGLLKFKFPLLPE